MRAERLGKYKIRLIGGAAGIVLGLSLLFTPFASALSIGGPSDCDDNAIVKCGVHSTSDITAAYNSSAYIRAVYATFGISAGDISNIGNTAVAGHVTKDGSVFVDSQSKAVATNAVTGGRQDIEPGSTRVNAQGAIFYRRPPSVSFQQSSLPAFVVMNNGRFQFAIIASCGNAVSATTTAPVPTPAPAVTKQTPAPKVKAPAAQPAPAPTQTQSQSQSVNVTNNNTQNVQASAPQPTSQTTTSSTPPAQTSSAPTSLVNTGPAGTVGVFLASVGLGTIAYRRFLVRRLQNT